MYDRPFRWWVQSVMPLVFDDSLSYYEVLAKLTKYIEGLTGDVEQIEKILATIEGIGDITQFTEFLESIQRQIGNLENLQTDTKSNLVSAINEVALKADIAYWKPPTGIPESDLSQEVQDKLNRIDTQTEYIINNVKLNPAPANNSPTDLGLGTYTVPDGGIPWNTLSSDVRDRITSAGSGGTTNYDDLNNKPQINGHTLNAGDNSSENLGIGTYSKPIGGIPESDLSAEVQEKLNTSGSIADNQLTYIASRDYEAGELLYINGVLYKTKYKIIAGTNLIPGNNIETTDISTEIERINNEIDALQSGSGPDSWNLTATVESNSSSNRVDFFEYFNCIGGENYNFIVDPVNPGSNSIYYLIIKKRDGTIVLTEYVSSIDDANNRYRFTFTPTDTGEYYCTFYRGSTSGSDPAACKVTIEYTQSQGISELWNAVNEASQVEPRVDAIETLTNQHTTQIQNLEPKVTALEVLTAEHTGQIEELQNETDDLKNISDKELTTLNFSPSLYVDRSGNYWYFDTTNLKIMKSNSKKYVCMTYMNRIRPDYVSMKCNAENIKMKILCFDEPASASTSGSTGYIGTEPYTTDEIIIPKGTKNFLLNFTTIDGTAITAEQLVDIQSNIVINKLADTSFIRGKTEFGGISASGYLTNADVWMNTRSEKMYKINGHEQITIEFDEELPNYVANITIYFYDENCEFLSSMAPPMNVQNGFLPSFTMPDDGAYFKILVNGVSGTNIKRHEYFTIRTRNQIEEVYNPNIINTSVSGSLAFSYEVSPDAETSGRLLLPPNYSVNGDKVPLIVFVHGSGCMMSWGAVMGDVTNAGQSLSYLPYLQYLANEGFAVFDCYPWSNKETIQSGTFSPFIAPINIASYMRGIEYVCSRFNVDKSKVSMICKSQGGHIGNWAIMQKQFPFRTVSMLAPSCGIGLSFLFASNKCREALTKYIAFEGTNEEISAFITSGSLTNANVASFVSKNKGKLLSMCPMAQGITNGSLDTLLDGCTHGQSTVPQWMLDLGLPDKPEGALDIYTLSNNSDYVKNGAIPSKFWAAFDDAQVSGYSVFSTYYWLCNGASDTEFRQLPNGTGGHHAMDTDPNALKSSGTTALGITYTDVPTAYVEIVDFIRSRYGD